MKKRLTAIIMAAALMLSAAACSTTSGQNSTASEASVASTASESKETESSDQQASQPEKATSIENWNEDIASVTEDGVVKGLKVGRAYRIPKMHVLSYLKLTNAA